MKTITKIVKITNGRIRESVEVMGDVSGMIVVEPQQSVVNGRLAVFYEWYNEVTNDGFEKCVITLHDWEV